MSRIAAGIILLALSFSTWAWSPKDSRVEVVTPVAIAGTTGRMAMLIKEEMVRRGVNATLVQKQGAQGMIGAGYIASSAPDGLTVGLISTSTLMPTTNVDMKRYTNDSFVYITAMGETHFMLTAKPDAPDSALHFVRTLMKKPDSIIFGTSTASQVNALRMLTLALNVDITKVVAPAYASPSQMFLDMAGSRIGYAIAAPPRVVPLAQSGKIQLLATTSINRIEYLPGLPTLAEFVPGYEFVSYGLFVLPKGVSEAVRRYYSTLLRSIIRDPKIRDKFYSEPIYSSPVTFGEATAKSIIAKEQKKLDAVRAGAR